MIAAQHHALGIDGGGERALYIARNIYHHRPGLAVSRDVERLGHGLGNLVRAVDEKIMLGNSARKPGGVGLLKSVGTDLRQRNLPADENERHSVHIRRTETGDGVGEPRTARDHRHARLP